MATQQIGMFRCEVCDLDFDSMDALTDHNVQQPPGTMPDDAPADLIHGSSR